MTKQTFKTRSETFTTFFFPVGDHIQQIVYDWVRYLKEELLWGNDDPLFPKTNVITGEDRFLKRLVLSQNIGVRLHQYGQFLKMPLKWLICFILIRIAFA